MIFSQMGGNMRIINAVLIALFCCGLASLLFAADTGYPTGSTLQDYALQKNNPVISSSATVKLRARLESHVSDFITETRWAPMHEWFGITSNRGDSELSMTEPADVFLALSLA